MWTVLLNFRKGTSGGSRTFGSHNWIHKRLSACQERFFCIRVPETRRSRLHMQFFQCLPWRLWWTPLSHPKVILQKTTLAQFARNFPPFGRPPRVNNRVAKSSSLDHILSNMSPVNTLMLHLFIHFNIILPSTCTKSGLFHSFLIYPMRATRPAQGFY